MSDQALTKLYINPPTTFLGEELGLLQAHLSDALALKKVLENDICQIVRSNDLESPGSIAILPIELLVEILHAVVEDNRWQIRDLMLVCRAWSRLILNTPRFWSKLRVYMPNDHKKIARCISYCSTYIERSAGHSLDIKVDCSALMLAASAAWAPVTELSKMICGPQAMRMRTRFERRDSQDHRDIYNYYEQFYIIPLKILCGANFETMARWRSYEFVSGPYWNFDRSSSLKSALQRNVFSGRTPLLERLIIRHFDWDQPSLNTIVRLIFRMRRSMSEFFPDLPNLRELILDHFTGSQPDVDQLNALKIERLELQCFELKLFEFVVRCHNVTYMRIDFSWRPNWRPDNPEKYSLDFPCLAHLILDSTFPKWFLKRIAAPSLMTIGFQEMYALYHARNNIELPTTVRRVELLWSSIDTASKWQVKEAIRPLIESPFIETLLCMSRGRPEVEKALKDLKAVRGKLLKTLIVVPVVRRGVEVDPRDIKTIDLT